LDYFKLVVLEDFIWCRECESPHGEGTCYWFRRAAHLFGDDECLSSTHSSKSSNKSQKAYAMLEMCHRMREELDDLVLAFQTNSFDDLVLAFQTNSFDDLLDKAKDKYEALNSLVVFDDEKYLKSAHVKQED
jgi:hypothetical protein